MTSTATGNVMLQPEPQVYSPLSSTFNF